MDAVWHNQFNADRGRNYKMIIRLLGALMFSATFSVLSHPDKALADDLNHQYLNEKHVDVSTDLLKAIRPMPYGHEERMHALLVDILEHVGLDANFVDRPAPVPNALAYMDSSGKRLILYNPAFMDQVAEYGEGNWPHLMVLLHEVGHHLQGHLFEAGPEFKHREIEADRFSGFMAYRMGATLDQAVSVASHFAQEWDTPTHPPRDERLRAIINGWEQAEHVAAHEFELNELRNERNPPKVTK
ncbi:MAG: hypothetical protein O9283_03530 [Sphingomonadaceae bacterium]|nr:hypothetical protein [Sphingomonadaceae bacterium]